MSCILLRCKWPFGFFAFNKLIDWLIDIMCICLLFKVPTTTTTLSTATTAGLFVLLFIWLYLLLFVKRCLMLILSGVFIACSVSQYTI